MGKGAIPAESDGRAEGQLLQEDFLSSCIPVCLMSDCLNYSATLLRVQTTQNPAEGMAGFCTSRGEKGIPSSGEKVVEVFCHRFGRTPIKRLIYRLRIRGVISSPTSDQLQAFLGHTACLLPDHCNSANISIKQVKGLFWCPLANKSYVYTGAG